MEDEIRVHGIDDLVQSPLQAWVHGWRDTPDGTLGGALRRAALTGRGALLKLPGDYLSERGTR